MKLIGASTEFGNFEFKITWDGKNDPEIEIKNGFFDAEGGDQTNKSEIAKAVMLKVNELVDGEIKKLEVK